VQKLPSKLLHFLYPPSRLEMIFALKLTNTADATFLFREGSLSLTPAACKIRYRYRNASLRVPRHFSRDFILATALSIRSLARILQIVFSLVLRKFPIVRRFFLLLRRFEIYASGFSIPPSSAISLPSPKQPPSIFRAHKRAAAATAAALPNKGRIRAPGEQPPTRNMAGRRMTVVALACPLTS